MLLCAFIISFPNFSAGMLFILVGALDYHRRIFLMHRLSGLLVDPFLIPGWTPSTSQTVPLPLLNCSKANNVALWLEMRAVFKDFGLQFFHRVQAYATFWSLSVAAMLAFLFWNIYSARVDFTGVMLVSFDLLVLLAALLYMMAAAITLNHLHEQHRKILLGKLCDMQRHLSLLTGSDPAAVAYARAVEQARRMVSVAIQVVVDHDTHTPVKFMGFTADTNLLRALVTAGGSGVAAAGKLISDARK